MLYILGIFGLIAWVLAFITAVFLLHTVLSITNAVFLCDLLETFAGSNIFGRYHEGGPQQPQSDRYLTVDQVPAGQLARDGHHKGAAPWDNSVRPTVATIRPSDRANERT